MKKDKKIKYITLLIIIFMVILLFLCSISLAKNIEGVIINSGTQVAEPILIIENNPSIDITATKNHGIYSFKVKNYNNQNKISDVDMKYYIQILSNTDKSIDFKLYQDNKQINLKDNKTDYIKMPKEEMISREYKIEITYDKNKNISVNDIIQKIQVKIHSEQGKG